MSASEYQEKYWGRLREAIDKMLTPPPQGCRPISFEEVSFEVNTPPSLFLERHVNVISRELLFLELHARFTTVPFNLCPVQFCIFDLLSEK